MVLTDERIVFAPEESDGTDDAGVVAYDQLAGVETGDAIELRSVDGVTWRLPVEDADDRTTRYLRWLGRVRGRVVATRNDAEVAAGQIRTATEEHSWDEAREAYRQARDRVDDLICAVQRGELDQDVLAPELTGIERTLEHAHARLCIERARSRLELGRQLVENGSYDRAGTVLATAQEWYDRARSRVEEVRRGDDFRFGEQRDLETALERLAWEIESVAAEPVRQAQAAEARAREAEYPATAIERWQQTLERYRAVRTLERSDSDWRFASDEERVADELRAAAGHLIDGHLEVARNQWNAGIEAGEADEIKDAIRLCTDARDHVERASELAAEFRPGETARLQRRLERMEEAIQHLRVTATIQRERIHASEVRDGETDAERPPRTADEIAEIDTHHEIQYDLDNGDGNGTEDTGSDGGYQSETIDLGDGAQREPGS